ncbi:UvrD/REP helicase [Xylanimonas cellulosilytica DSM 15894]|uniref:DNA 3'-5' helicase n=1 Tax=Xylanimonas cellulosilytica (strain DSM 15894 / JCM 12276 / CECT 5975 / KCTC 9989 / LMG 20990 / NBRC 107835 / XIL07) TaxID=446471 RepID=D1BXK7_XYLCX|nr:UrvD/REP family ATP-dependent DNA helicase [Xylanimonas cellulosilytica]ACZ29817.1 UvrD/REP helicase [Xylanimonas cellulosilytica DSM 15894]
MTTTFAPRLVPPAPVAGPEVDLDATQAAAVAEARTASALLVAGAPGTGKTTVATAIAVEAVTSWGLEPSRVLVLGSSRRLAARLRDQVAAASGRTLGAPLVRTASSAAFAVLRTRAAALGEPTPTLVSGPEQDLVLAELLAGHLEGEGAPLLLPDGLPSEALGLRGLRQELRDLLMRAAERGIRPDELAQLGRTHARPEWSMAAQLYEEYLDVTALRLGTPDSGARFDPAVVVDEAAQSLAAWEEELPGVPRPSWDLVVVDDYQEATVATARLLHALRDSGARLVLLADPDSAVQGFRGATPGLVGRASAPPRSLGAFGAEEVVLGTVWRQTPELRDVTRVVTTRIPTVGGPFQRGASAVVPDDGASDGDGVAHGDDGVVPYDDASSNVAGHDADDGDDGPGTTSPDGLAAAGGPAPSGVAVAVLAGQAQEAAFIARELRAEHLLHGTPWERMVVIARSGDRLGALRRDLVAASVPVALLGSDVPLREEPAVAPLLAALRVSAGTAPGSLDAVLAELVGGDDTATSSDPDGLTAPEPYPLLDAETAAALLTSPVGGLDAVALRRLRRALRAEELAGGGGRSSDALLVELLDDPARAVTLPNPVKRGAVTVARVLAAGRAAAGEPGATAQTVLWAVWDATGLAARWRDAALAGGPAGVRADRDLDAVLALFRAAETYVDRMPGAPVAAFVDYLSSQDLPADSLAASASGAHAVEALTPAGAAGREWDVAVVAGVQDGVWPDLRLRDSLLGSQALVELLAGRSQDAHGLGPDARKQVLADELRAFAVAISRARRRLLVTAVEDAEDAPSVFCDLVVPPGEDEERDPRRVEVAAPLDLRGVVATARATLLRAVAAPSLPVVAEAPPSSVIDAALPVVAAALPVVEPVETTHEQPGDVVSTGSTTGGHGSTTEAQTAAALLADLAAAGVPEADPRTWYGVAGASSDAPLWADDAVVPVSPSKVETVTTCALRWSFEAAGGTAADDQNQTLGTLVHAIAEALPTGSLSALKAELDRRWPQLALPPGWPARQLRQRAEQMIEHLATYLADAGSPLAVEAEFDVEVGRARLRGKVDRVEDAGDGAAIVADLKTGRKAPTVDQSVTHPQLGAYQLAVEAGAIDGATRSAGARLVFVGTDTKKPTMRVQPALAPEPDGSSWASALVEGAADTMASERFAAHPNDLCPMCPVRRSCPLQPEGRSVVA